MAEVDRVPVLNENIVLPGCRLVARADRLDIPDRVARQGADGAQVYTGRCGVHARRGGKSTRKGREKFVGQFPEGRSVGRAAGI